MYNVFEDVLPPRQRDRVGELENALIQAGALGANMSGTDVYKRQAPEFALSKEQLGTFWQALLPQIPAGGSDPVWPDWLCRILEGLCAVEGCFCAGDGAPSPEVYEAVLAHHWKEYFHVYFSPEETVRCWDLARNENALCELLLQRFPHVFSPREQQLIQEGLTDELLETVRRRDPLLALRLWRTLLDAAQAHLDNPEAAEVLLDESVAVSYTHLDVYKRQELGISVNTLDKLREERKIGFYQTCYGGRVRFSRAHLEKYIEKIEKPPVVRGRRRT